MNGAVDFLTRLGPARIAAMGVVTFALVGFFAFVIMRVSQPTMGVLFAELSLQDANAVMKDLDARAIRYETRGDGQTILVPRQDLARIRMELAGKGLPSGGGVGYEIFDKGDAFSSTSFVQGINHLRALEGELSRTIRSIGRVEGARVHLVMPERRLFERDREPPRASIVLKLRGELDAAQVRAVRHLVASAVEGLKPERVSIVDERGRLLADGAQGDMAAGGMAVDEKQAGIERRLKAQVEEIVAGVVGSGRARVQVAAELDLNRIESRSESFDPESRVVRSTQTRAENQASSGADGAVSVGRELPGAAQPGGGGSTRDASNKNEEIVNYEISRTTRTEILESGRVKRLSVAVLLDGVYAQGRRRRDDLPAAPAGGARPHRRARPHRGRVRQEPRRPARGREPALCRDAGRGAGRRDAAPHLAVQPDQGGPAAADRDRGHRAPHPDRAHERGAADGAQDARDREGEPARSRCRCRRWARRPPRKAASRCRTWPATAQPRR